MRVSASQLEFLGRLGKSPDGVQLMAVIKAEQELSNERLRTLTGEDLYREQGKAVYLDRLAGLLKTSAMPPRDLSSRLPTARD